MAKKRFVVIALVCLSAGSVLGQDKKWSDSYHFIYTKTDPNGGVQIDTVVSLLPRSGTDGNDRALNYALNGIVWQWPDDRVAIGSAEDFDNLSSIDPNLFLVTDKNFGKILVYNASSRLVTWEYPSSPATKLILPIDAEFYSDLSQGISNVLITDNGGNRVIRVNYFTKTEDWAYGDGSEGAGFNQLDSPADAEKIPDVNEIIIADQGNNRVIIVDISSKQVVWSFDELNSPVDVEYIPAAAQVLVTDENNHRAIIIDRSTKEIVWQFGTTAVADSGRVGLKKPADADYLTNGHILIADAGNNRAIEVNLDGTYFWQLKQRLPRLKDIDQINTNDPQNIELLAVQELTLKSDPDLKAEVPSRIAYKSQWVESPVFQLAQQVDFDQLYWQAQTARDTTAIFLQLRTGKSPVAINGANYYGPSDIDTLYSFPGQKIRSRHDGDNYYQFRAWLETKNPKESPVLDKVSIAYHYYTADVTPKPYFFSSAIGITAEQNLIPKWKQLIVNQITPANLEDRQNIRLAIRIIENRPPYATLADNIDINMNTASDTVSLQQYDALKGVKSIILNGYPWTSNPALTPKLTSWEVVYEEVQATASKLFFVDADGLSKSAYTVAESFPSKDKDETVDMANLLLDDNDFEVLTNRAELTIQSAGSNDTETASLELQPPYFRTLEGIPIIISNRINANNDTLEVFDRDTLKVTYHDFISKEDSSFAKILVVKGSRGELYIENQLGVAITGVNYNDSLYVRVVNEQDKNLDSLKQDSLRLFVKNNATIDEEEIYLYEIADNSDVFNTAEFRSRKGLYVVKDNNGVANDGQIQSSSDQKIIAEYVDNFTLTKSVSTPPAFAIDLGGEPYIVEVAPNPFRESAFTNFRLRLASATGSITVKKIEIFNVAGEKVREIRGEELIFSDNPIPVDRYGIADNWWNLQNDSGHKVSSGTYFLKVHADLRPETATESERVMIYRKFVIVR